MYRVYRDPDGKRFLEQNNHRTSVKLTTSNEIEEDYRKRIENLNGEIKVLNDELEKVHIIINLCHCLRHVAIACYLTFFCSTKMVEMAQLLHLRKKLT